MLSMGFQTRTHSNAAYPRISAAGGDPRDVCAYEILAPWIAQDIMVVRTDRFGVHANPKASGDQVGC